MEFINFTEVKNLDLYNKNIVYQGERGAYTEEACREFFGVDIDFINVGTWRDAFEAIKGGIADYGVVPFENSTAGIISENFDLLDEYGFFIVGEQIIKIDHCLLGVKGASLSDIRTVYSHPQAFAQCSHYFDEHREFEKINSYNTAIAAKEISGKGDKSLGAVAGRTSAGIYSLDILCEAIQNNKGNRTRFIVIGKEPVYVEGSSKISLGLQLKNEAGSLYHALSVFHRFGLNMTSIESRPIPGMNWEYKFFIDLEGNLSSEKIQIAMEILKKESVKLTVFGNY